MPWRAAVPTVSWSILALERRWAEKQHVTQRLHHQRVRRKYQPNGGHRLLIPLRRDVVSTVLWLLLLLTACTAGNVLRLLPISILDVAPGQPTVESARTSTCASLLMFSRRWTPKIWSTLKTRCAVSRLRIRRERYAARFAPVIPSVARAGGPRLPFDGRAYAGHITDLENSSMIKLEPSLIANAADTFEVMVLFSREDNGKASVPLGPEALGYLTATADGYVFVRSPRPENDNGQAEHDPACWTVELEESCF